VSVKGLVKGIINQLNRVGFYWVVRHFYSMTAHCIAYSQSKGLSVGLDSLGFMRDEGAAIVVDF